MAESSNVPRIIIRNRDRTAVVTRTFTVEGAPVAAAQYSGKPFSPDMVTVVLQDGALHHVTIRGQRILAGGKSAGQDGARRAWYSIGELKRDAPLWVQDAVSEVLRMEGA
jgi:hypothetical protein